YTKIKHYYALPHQNYIGKRLSGIDTIINVLFYPASFFVGAYIIGLLPLGATASRNLLIGLFQFLTLPINLLFAYLYYLIVRKFPFPSILKDRLYPGAKSLKEDIGFGLKTLFLALFPLLTLMFFFDGILLYFQANPPAQQEAVRFLIESLSSFPTLILAIFAIVIVAPIVEEYLFRGIIQTYLRQKIGAKNAILLSSFLFSCIHFSWSQGMQNIFILISLFLLGLYLGFIYEKNRSIIANITLHVTFNLISTIVIIITNT
ncbi:CPBP family intramembrane metalloprotease, partial [bacterium]|nr:CPBP family intramembrane metalloprotease [bacterium]